MKIVNVFYIYNIYIYASSEYFLCLELPHTELLRNLFCKLIETALGFINIHLII